MSHLIEPHGGKLIDLMVTPERREELRELSREIPSWDLTPRQLCDLELLLNGGFSPLAGFLGQADYESVCEPMRLADGTLWPMPITLDVTEALADAARAGRAARPARPRGRDARRAPRRGRCGSPTARPRPRRSSAPPTEPTPASAHLLNRTNPSYVGGPRRGRSQLPSHYDFRDAAPHARPSCAHEFARLGWRKIVAFQTRNPMHRAHHELTLRAAQEVEANLLIHPVGGHDQARRPRPLHPRALLPGAAAPLPAQHGACSRCCRWPCAWAGPREALWHAIIRKNHGCTHFIVGRDHAGPGNDSHGQAVLRPLRRPGAAAQARGRARRRRWCRSR